MARNVIAVAHIACTGYASCTLPRFLLILTVRIFVSTLHVRHRRIQYVSFATTSPHAVLCSSHRAQGYLQAVLALPLV